jgi:hypothetical protein
MGKFKDENGKTRVGVFLQQVAPDILNMAGNLTGVSALNKLSEVIGGSSGLNTAQKANALELLQIDIQQEQERTKRHASDMASDSWLSKNIRPMTLGYLLIVVVVLTVLDSAIESFTVAPGFLNLFTSLSIAAFSFYFVMRDVNKIIINKKK